LNLLIEEFCLNILFLIIALNKLNLTEQEKPCPIITIFIKAASFIAEKFKLKTLAVDANLLAIDKLIYKRAELLFLF